MGLILWIDQNEFATALVAKVFKKKGLPFYSLSLARDFSYLVEDLRPGVLVLDVQTVTESLIEFESEMNKSELTRQTPVILIGEGDVPGVNLVGRIPRKMDPFTIPETIASFLKDTL